MIESALWFDDVEVIPGLLPLASPDVGPVQSLLSMPVLQNTHKTDEYEGFKDFIAGNEVEIM